MKLKFSVLLITAALLAAGIFQNNINTVKADSSWPEEPSISSGSAVLIDASTGTVLYGKKENKIRYPASITKIMTALLTIENCDMDETVTFSSEAVDSLSYDDANFGCQVGEEMSVKDCLYVLMLASANEVATALAEHIAGSVDAFAEMMNERAVEAGALNTHFANANGLHDDDHYVTAYDMAMITIAASQYDVFNEIVNTTSYTVGTNNMRDEEATAYQRHKMVWPENAYYYEGIIGGKTGYTDQSGTTLVTYAERDGMTLVAVVLKSTSATVYTDTTNLLDYGFDNFDLLSAADYETRFQEEENYSLTAPFSDAISEITIDPTSKVLVPKNVEFSDLDSEINFELTDSSFATITYSYEGIQLGTANLIYTETSTEDSGSDISSSTEGSDTTSTLNESGDDSSEDELSSENTSSSGEDTASSVSIGRIIKIAVIAVVILILVIAAILYKRDLEAKRRAKRNRRNRYTH